MDCPKLRRNIDIIPGVHNQQEGFLLRDSLNPEITLFVPRDALPLLSFLDGTQTIRDIQYRLLQQTGEIIVSDQIEEFIRQLDEHYFLESEHYHQLLETLLQDYKSRPVRPAWLAGKSYPSGAQEAENYLERLFLGIHFPMPENLPETLSGFVVPHIEIERGKNTYIRVYECVKRYPPADLYIILGVNHHFSSDNPFIITDRTYETPLGIAPVDRALLTHLERTLSWDVMQDDLAHRQEHSIEFQALFLRHIYHESPFTILPVLCNFEDRNHERVREFIVFVKEYMQNSGRRCVVVASVDFSHIGPQFGWQRVVQTSDIVDIELQDRATLALLAAGKSEHFFDDITTKGNPRNIDAFAACYVFLQLLAPTTGTLIQYEQAFHPQNTVTFAGLIY